MTKYLKKAALALISGALMASAASAGPINGVAWKSKCADGSTSSSFQSLGYAICGCANHGGSIEYPKFQCRGMTPATVFQQSVPVKAEVKGASKLPK